jgi:hypothetical protein
LDGEGRFRCGTGVYEGQWLDGAMSGEGTFEAVDGSVALGGTWGGGSWVRGTAKFLSGAEFEGRCVVGETDVSFTGEMRL